MAVYQKRHEACLALLDRKVPFVFNHQDRSPLHVAVSKSDLNLVGLMLSRGHDPNARPAKTQSATPLHIAVAMVDWGGWGDPEDTDRRIVENLILAGADPSLSFREYPASPEISTVSLLRGPGSKGFIETCVARNAAASMDEATPLATTPLRQTRPEAVMGSNHPSTEDASLYDLRYTHCMHPWLPR
jgi:hypothetical protein